jgi:hypothetical protein
VDLEHYRKDAKKLARSFRAGERDAVGRAERILGERAHKRFQLSDAQHIVALENGYRTWPDLKAAQPTVRVVDTGLEYRPGEPVLVRTVQRRHTLVTDDGAALEMAGRLPGWREIGDRLERDLCVNVSRNGAVFLPVVGCGPGYDAIVRRVAEAALALYQDVLDLEE